MGAPDAAIAARMRAQTSSKGIDIGTGVAATIAPNADAPGHRQCGSYASATPEISSSSSSSKTGWGGARANSGGARPNSGGARLNSGGARDNAGGARDNSGGAREHAGGARPNSGGCRKGAGRKRKSKAEIARERIAASVESLAKPAAEGARWYCTAVHPQLAIVALGELVKQGFTAWAPRVDQPRTGAAPRRLALFPGYVFVRFSLTYDPWWQINGTPGVRGLFPIAGERPWPIPWAQMDELFGNCDADGIYTKDRVAMPGTVLEVGDNVMVTNGPFTSFPAKVLTATRETVGLEIMIFGRPVQVEYPHDMVEKAGQG